MRSPSRKHLTNAPESVTRAQGAHSKLPRAHMRGRHVTTWATPGNPTTGLIRFSCSLSLVHSSRSRFLSVSLPDVPVIPSSSRAAAARRQELAPTPQGARSPPGARIAAAASLSHRTAVCDLEPAPPRREPCVWEVSCALEPGSRRAPCAGAPPPPQFEVSELIFFPS